MRTRFVVAAAAVVFLLAACGGDQSDDPKGGGESDPMTSIEEGLKQIDSGRIQVAIRAISPDVRPVSFEMSGTFAAADDPDSLPIADLKYVDRSGVKPSESSFISDGERAWVVNERGTKELEGDQLDGLKGGSDVPGLRTLEPTTWFEGAPKAAPGEKLDGVTTTSYSGIVDVVALIEDVTRMSANLGAYVADEITDEGAERVRNAAQNASLEVVAGKDDHLLRTVRFGVDIPTDPKDLAVILRELAANRIEFELSVSEINQPVTPPKTPEGAAV